MRRDETRAEGKIRYENRREERRMIKVKKSLSGLIGRRLFTFRFHKK
jgi:hypothetical protein